MINLLVVDNDDVQRRKVVREAQRANFVAAAITTAKDENEARELVDKSGPGFFNFAVIDLSLKSDGDDEVGVELIRWLHSFDRYCYIIALTLHRRNEGGVRAMRAGAKDFISLDWTTINGFELLAQKLSILNRIAEEALPKAETVT